MAPRLLAVTGPLKGSAFPLATGDLRIGRDLSNEIPITDSAVSRYHSVVTPVEATWVVRDLGSMNGTYVNRERVEVTKLAGHDEVQIGRFRLVFFVGE